MLHRLLLTLLATSSVLLTAPARAEVVHAEDNGFTVQWEKTVHASPQKVYRLLVEHVGDWWESSHTYSGDAQNMFLEAREKGWFGERLPDDGIVQHMEVLYVAPNKKLRMRGSLGPLQGFAVTGVITIDLVPKGDATLLRLVYHVGGYMPNGLKTLAGPVNHVLSSQFSRLAKFAEDKPLDAKQ